MVLYKYRICNTLLTIHKNSTHLFVRTEGPAGRDKKVSKLSKDTGLNQTPASL